jgi:signal transduction histidine kinase
MNESTDKGMIAGLQLINERLTSELFEVNKRLKESEAFKSHFISNITNEILNPFSSILALSENIRNLGEADMAQAKKMADLIHQEAFQLDFQLKNIFAAAMTEAGRDDLIPVTVNLADLVKQAIHFFKTEIKHKQLEIDLTIEDREQERLRTFSTDELKLELIVKNLLSNAIKFSQQKGQIKISVGIRDKRFAMDIRDFGKGIPKNEYKVIFNRFKQLDESANSFNTGQGLGLSIVKAYLLELNGKIELETPEDGGLKIGIELPELNLPDEYDDLGEFLFNSEEKF